VYVAGAKNFPMTEYDEVVKSITDHADPDAQVISGLYIDDSLGDRIRVTVIATGFGTEEREEQREAAKTETGHGEDTVTQREFETIALGKPPRCLPPRNFGVNCDDEELAIPTALRLSPVSDLVKEQESFAAVSSRSYRAGVE